MPKPEKLEGYTASVTEGCERVLVTLLHGLGPYKQSVYLVGGLVPRYSVRRRPPKVPAHAGTADVDVVVDLGILADTEAYKTLEENLKRMGFERATNDAGQKLSWQWQTKLEDNTTMIIEFLADAPEIAGGRVQPLPAKGNVSAINIPHASMVFDFHNEMDVTAELLGENGRATEKVRFANIVSHTCLKAFAYDQRGERKDAHDLVYCLEHADNGLEAAVNEFVSAAKGKHGKIINSVIDILVKRFCDDKNGEGYRKDGPVSVARFEPGGDDTSDFARNRRLVRQRQVSDVISVFVAAYNAGLAT
jgi:hypothetical protein